jgi:hypothetical protein
VRGVLSAHGDARGWIGQVHVARAWKMLERIAMIALTRLDSPHGRRARERRLTPHMSPSRFLVVSPLCCSPSCGGGEEKLLRELEEPSKLLSAKTAVSSALQETASRPVDIPESSIAIELLQYLSLCIRQSCLRFVDNGSVLCGMHCRVGHREGYSPKDASLPCRTMYLLMRPPVQARRTFVSSFTVLSCCVCRRDEVEGRD